jgi:Raf kinase inhibitor-like YbhB/YbcL family protein
VRLWSLAVVVLLAGCGGGGEKVSSGAPPAPGGLLVTSPDVAPGGRLPAADTCAGAGRRPPLRLSPAPAGARELAVVVIDPDAGGFVHWTAYGVPPRTRRLAATGLPRGAREGENSFGDRGWGAPCPPKGDGPHRYAFVVYWLRRPSDLASGASPGDALARIGDRAGGSGRLVARFGRT